MLSLVAVAVHARAIEKAENTHSLHEPYLLAPSSDESPVEDVPIYASGDNIPSDRYYYLLATGEDPHDLRRGDEGIFRQPYMDPHTSEVGR